MAKETNITIATQEGQLPENFGKLLSDADENDLRVMVGILMLCRGDGGAFNPKELPALLGMEQAEINASLKFWRGAGLIKSKKQGSSAKETERQTEAEPSKASSPSSQRTTAHKNGALERSSSLGEYTSAELATLMEQRRVSAELIDEAQKIMGKMFRVYDTGILVGIVDQLGFEEEAVLAILAYTVRQGKKTLRYAERMAMAFYDEGITDTVAVLERINRIEQSAKTAEKIKQLFGFGSRELTATEKKLFTAWTETFGYDLEVIRLAYDITVDTIQKPVPKYTGSILESWHKEGLKSADEVREYLEASRGKKPAAVSSGNTPKSYDLDEFFDAAIRRGLKDLP